MGQIAHVGKRAVFGLGRYRLLRDPDIRSFAYDPAHGPRRRIHANFGCVSSIKVQRKAPVVTMKTLTRRLGLISVLALAMSLTACGGENPMGGSQGDSGSQQASAMSESASSKATMEGTTTAGQMESGEVAELAEAEIGAREEASMLPAGGKKPDKPQPLPEDPPEGIEVYPATTNRTLDGPIDYERQPPTNGDHDPLWQNCGFYPEPIKDRHAVHSMDHGVVWISYRPNLPAAGIDELRSYAGERYVIVSPYPGLDAPVVATSWRVQLKLDGADDPRLRQFVDQFRISEISPLSGNKCVGGAGDPEPVE